MSIAKTSITNRRRSMKHSISKQNEDSSNQLDSTNNLNKLQFIIEKMCVEKGIKGVPLVREYQEIDGKKINLNTAEALEQNAQVWTDQTSRFIEIFHDKELYLKKILMVDLLLNETVLSVLLDCILQFDTLTVLRLDYCNLTSKNVQYFAELLNINNVNLKELSLKGNPNDSQNFDVLMTKSLEIISLKLCEIDNVGMEKLTKWFTENCVDTNLIYLDLSSNLIFNENVKYLADILRCNRKLKFLNIADCKITDEGIEEFMTVFEKFTLTSDEIYQRRKLRFDYFRALDNENNDNSIQELSNSKPENPKSDLLNNETKKLDEVKEKLRLHPFTDQTNTFAFDGKLWCKGNSTLNYLNLSYNRFTNNSFKSILKTLEIQKQQFGNKKGLHHLILEGTDFQKNSQPEIEEIQRFLMDKITNQTESEIDDLEAAKSDHIAGEIAGKIKKMKENRSSVGSKKSRFSKQSNK